LFYLKKEGFGGFRSIGAMEKSKKCILGDFGRFWTILEISEKFPTSEGEISRKSPKFRKSEKKSEKI
jgi:hypothetical protein